MVDTVLGFSAIWSVNCEGMRYHNKDDSFLSSMEVHSLSSSKSKVVRHWSYERAEYDCFSSL